MDGARSRRAEDMIPSAFARIHRDDDDNDNSIGSRKRITVERSGNQKTDLSTRQKSLSIYDK